MSSVPEKVHANDAKLATINASLEVERKESQLRMSNIPLGETRFPDSAFRSTHEDLQEKAHSQDLQIQALLLQFDKLKADHRINEWKARADTLDLHDPVPGLLSRCGNSQKYLTCNMVEAKGRDIERPRWNTRTKSAEYAVASYFSPGKSTRAFSTTHLIIPSAGIGLGELSAPDIVKYCGLHPEDIIDLFTM